MLDETDHMIPVRTNERGHVIRHGAETLVTFTYGTTGEASRKARRVSEWMADPSAFRSPHAG